jgi:Leucine-rich repeat (LRR) protein
MALKYNPLLLVIRFLAVATILFVASSTPNLPPDQFNALWDLYNNTHGNIWMWQPATPTNQIWNFSALNPNPCFDFWQGITCSCVNSTTEGERCELVGLHLSYYGLKGSLPSSIGAWTSLRSLVLEDNEIVGPLPVSIKTWTQLTTLNLYFNNFAGPFPVELLTLQELVALNLGWNHFYGTIPASINNLTKLVELNLYANLFRGTIPSTITDLKLTGLNLGINFLSGTIPAFLGELHNLSGLVLGVNNFTGTVPSSFGNLTMLQALYLNENRLRSPLPSTLGNLANLIYLGLYVNEFSEFFPAWIINLTKLEVLTLWNNSFYGTLPENIGTALPKLSTLQLENNVLSGTLPQSFVNLDYLGELILSWNHFHGKIQLSPRITSFDFLEVPFNFFSGQCNGLLGPASTYGFDVSGNLFTGMVPNSSHWNEMEAYFVGNNYLTGTIPDNFLVSAANLGYFSIGENFITGTLPDYFFNEKFKSLLGFNASFNFLTGHFLTNYTTTAVITASSLEQIVINNNFFTGQLPTYLSSFPELLVLTLNNNQFTGTVPSTYQKLAHLQQLFVQYNNLQGQLNYLLTDILPKSLINLDVSNNEFTGSLPSQFFSGNLKLTTFAAVGNCLTGTLPNSICEVQTLTALALDGLFTAPSCRRYIYPNTQFHGFLLKHYIQGSLPACLFEIPTLKTLHLSGNGFTGSIPNSLNLSSTLTDLSLSHNVLTGTIPYYIQQHRWNSLDLSYNKFTGSLSNSFVTQNNQTVYMQVNRLSGTIPNQFTNIQTINILNGNLFDCDSSSTLPDNDPSKTTYICGSDATNDYLYAWVTVFGIILLLLFCVWCAESQRCGERKGLSQGKPIDNTQLPQPDGSLVVRFLSLLKSFDKAYNQYIADRPDSNVARYSELLIKIRLAFGLFGLLSILILLPGYSVISMYFKTYTNDYVWTVSAILSAGESAAMALFFLFLVLLCVIVYIVYFVAYFNDEHLDNITDHSKRAVRRWDSCSMAQLKEMCIGLLFNRILVAVLDSILYGVADFSFVYIVITYDEYVIDAAAVVLAGFKLLCNQFILRRAFPWFRSVGSRWNRSKDSEQEQESERTVTSVHTTVNRDYSVPDILFLERLMLFNNIVLPIIAILIILPDCFYNTFVAPTPVTSSYNYNNCAVYEPVPPANLTITQECAPTEQDTSYSPPFIYSYQCSSKVLINYAPVYLMKFIYIAFVRPAWILLLKYGYHHSMKNYGIASRRFKFFNYFLPTILKELSPRENNEEDGVSMTIYSKIALTTQLSSYFAIVIVFGGLFPPLAVVGCVSVIIMTYHEQLLLGRLLYNYGQRSKWSWYITKLEDDCGGFTESLNLSFKSTFWVLSSFYAFLLFDTWGDEKGWLSALAITIVMVSIPLAINVIDKRWCHVCFTNQLPKRSSSRAISMTHTVGNSKESEAHVHTENPILARHLAHV